MQALTRKLVSTATYTALAIVSGITIALLAQQINPLLLFLLIVAVPVGFYVFSAVPLIVLKVKKLFNHLRWWHVLWFLFFLSGLTFRIRGTENIQENPLDLAAFFRVALVGLVGFVLLGFFFLKRHFRVSIFFRGGLGALTAYALFSVLSTLWSAYPAWTFYKSIEYLVGVVLIGAIVASVRSIEDFKRLFDWMWLLVGLLLLSVWIGVFVWPSKAIYMYNSIVPIQIQGVVPIISANGVGTIGAILGIISFVRITYYKKSRLYIFVLWVSIISLFLAQTRSSWAAFFISFIIIVYLRYRYKFIFIFICFLSILVLMFGLGFHELLFEYFRRGQDVYNIVTLSGRTRLWDLVLTFVKDKPIWGYGSMAGTRFIISQFNVYGDAIISGADNVFLEVLLGTGVLGITFLLISIFWTYSTLMGYIRTKVNLELMLILESIGVLMILFVRAFFSAASFIWHPALTWLLILGFAEFMRRQYARIDYPQPLPPTRRRGCGLPGGGRTAPQQGT